MKSAFITLIIFIAIFAALKAGALDIIGSSAFHYFSFALFIAVFAAAYFLIGFQSNDTEQRNLPTQQDSEREVSDDK